MKKPHQSYDLPIPDDDYKMAYVMERDKLNFESRDIWVYLGADVADPTFAKVGITMKNMGSRSSSSANPRYYLFCAFQCRHDTTKERLRQIEKGALNYLDAIFGSEKRERHTESQILSECYYGINFEDFFFHLHDYLWENHYGDFQACDYVSETNPEWVYGGVLSFEFNERVTLDVRKRYLSMIVK
ncbi:hypothetical protein QNN86_08765 [Citrobacter sp. C348]|uniref:hypothetical protein n=1 Tax=Enterobacteriaceae TaxID=543 RepID=UPI001785EBA0|nr:hypothetical protein [Klebsiella aerogenes]MBE0175976.1 hypothetical protein [Klebsiella aerogenes]HDH0708496.1 hypothetical protein [Klebsiella aerogenes]HDU6101109.1 hypothetical protein [Klebsiella aerogenes]